MRAVVAVDDPRELSQRAHRERCRRTLSGSGALGRSFRNWRSSGDRLRNQILGASTLQHLPNLLDRIEDWVASTAAFDP
jgi:hypothetical protein